MRRMAMLSMFMIVIAVVAYACGQELEQLPDVDSHPMPAVDPPALVLVEVAAEVHDTAQLVAEIAHDLNVPAPEPAAAEQAVAQVQAETRTVEADLRADAEQRARAANESLARRVAEAGR